MSNTGKLKAIFFVNIIIVTLSTGGYFYVKSLIPDPPSFQIADLRLDQDVVQIGEPLQISVNVSNVGEETGDHSLTLTIDNVPIDTKNIQLSGGESTIVDFKATGMAEGNHTVQIGDLTKELRVTSETPLAAADIRITNLGISRTQAAVEEKITVSAMATNFGDEAGSYSMVLFVDDTERETRDIQLDGGETVTETFEIFEEAEGTYEVKIGSKTKIFEIISEAQPPEQAEFQVTNLVIKPNSVLVNETVYISVNVTNVGEESGSSSIELKINNTSIENRNYELPGATSKFINFEVVEANAGTYYVQIDGLSDSFTVEAPLPSSGNIKISRLFVSPYEVWEDDIVTIKATASNLVNEQGDVNLRLVIQDSDTEEVIEEFIKQFTLIASESKTIEFTISAGPSQTNSVKGYYVNLINLEDQSNKLTGYFEVAPYRFHTLIVSLRTTEFDLDFTLDGAKEVAPCIKLVEVGKHTIEVPISFTTDDGRWINFTNWEDGSTNPIRKLDLQNRTLITPYYVGERGEGGAASCPCLYVWNGNYYIYRGEVSDGPGWLGFVEYFREDGSAVFATSSPWDYIKLEREQLQPRNGFFDMIITQKWDEISYSDAAKLIVVDHSPDVNVFSNKGGVHLYDINDLGTIYTVSKNPLTPISAVNGEGKDVLSIISMRDGICTIGHTYEWDTIELNLGDLSDAEEIKLIVSGKTTWPSNEEASIRVSQFFMQPGIQPIPNPYIEVKDENGMWMRVPDNRQFPYLPVENEFLVVNLTGLFPTNEYRLRIHNFYNACFDYIGVDTSPQENVIIQEIYPIAELTQAFNTNSNSTGNFTRYGDVTPLLRYEDDEFVIMRKGDQIRLKFPVDETGNIPENMERDYFLYYAVWFKSAGLSYITYTVEPIPFQNMSSFPYPSNETYPYVDHLNYLFEYNTRTISFP